MWQRALTARGSLALQPYREHLREREGDPCGSDVFERLPVAVWLQDYSEVGEWLDSLKQVGIDDLREYFSEYPVEVDHCVGLIRLVDANAAAMEMVGATSKEEVLSFPLEEGLTDESRQSFVEQFVAISEGKDHVEIEMVGSKVNGDRFPCLLRGSMRSPSGRRDLSNVIVAIIDITERKDAEMRLEELVRSKDDLIASVSHEIRTPLTSIVGSSQLLYKDRERLSDTDKDEMFEILMRQSIDVANIVDDLIVAAQTDVGRLQVMSVPIDIRAEAAHVIEMWDQHAVDGVTLIDGGPVWCLGDPNRVRQIVRNLLSNALRHGGRRVHVITGSDDGAGYVRVVDDGPGIPEKDRERVFHKYESGTPIPGLTSALGLGLSISRHLADRMGGELTYHSDEGESLFELSLPLVPTEEQQGTPGRCGEDLDDRRGHPPTLR